MTEQHTNVRVRFAPSPTGHLHIGGVRTALFNWLFARHTGGTYLVRVEDTDVQRSTDVFLASQLRSLAWFGLMPDAQQPIVYQMSRVQEHIKAANSLVAQERAYPCFCPPRDADEVIHELEQGHGSKYSGTCRDKAYTPEDLQKPHAIRYKLPKELSSVEFHDLVVGTVKTDRDQLDDFVIVRRDGTPVYNFCVVIDDLFMKITHVIRGQDHISNTPKQVLLYRALDAKEPLFAHISLILGPSGAKLSKRDAAVSVEEYRLEGYLADALANYLVRLGWSHGDQEIFTRDQLVSLFSLDAVGKKGGIFDSKKLQWLNGIYMRQKTADQLLTALQDVNNVYVADLAALWEPATLHQLIDEYKQRCVTLVELFKNVSGLAHDPELLDVHLIAKWRSATTLPMLEAFADGLDRFDGPCTHDTVQALAEQVCASVQASLVTLAQPLRLALTGSIASPSVFQLIAIIGIERAHRRIRRLITVLAP